MRVGDLFTWWRHQMETFSALLAICVGNSPAIGEFPAQRPVTRSFGVFFDPRLNERVRKHKNISIIYIITPRWYDTGSWNICSCKTRSYLYYIVNVMGTWWWKEPGHQQPWHWLCWTGIIRPRTLRVFFFHMAFDVEVVYVSYLTLRMTITF